ncbi:MAG: non-ribosomal peptide synthetase [Betaproteobacteria bacterium]
MIDAQARLRPQAPALLAPGRSASTYLQLADRMRDIGSTLRSIGVKRSDRVAVVLPNGPEMAVATLASAAFATCAPLGPNYRREDLLLRLADLQPKVLLVPADGGASSRAAGAELSIRCLDVRWDDATPAGLFEFGPVRSAAAAPEIPPADGDVALVLYTTGTTSRPKLVPLTHDNLCRSAVSVASTLGLGPHDRCLNVMPLFHIHGFVAAVLASLSAGGSVACTPGFAEGKFVMWVDALRPTWYTAVPAVHAAILAEIAHATFPDIKGRLRFVRSSSAPLPTRVARELETAFGAPVVEAYGMTEAAHQIASNPLPPRVRKPGSVGLPAGPEVAVLEESGRIVDRDGTGEIVIRGENVTRGYVADPAANASAFVDGWFRTGDLGRIDADGYVSLTGRLKEIINRGGEKVSPREIDEALSVHPAVLQGVAFGVAHPTLGEDIVAAVLVKSGMHATEEEIRRFLIDRLDWIKVPSRVLIVDDIPSGDTGKVRRIDLAARFADRLNSSDIEPRDEIEALVVALFAEVLGIDRVGAKDNFFMLGGDSLRAGQVLARLSAQTGTYLPPIALFRSPSAVEFALEIRIARIGRRDEMLGDSWKQIERLGEQQVNTLQAREPPRNGT